MTNNCLKKPTLTPNPLYNSVNLKPNKIVNVYQILDRNHKNNELLIHHIDKKSAENFLISVSSLEKLVASL